MVAGAGDAADDAADALGGDGVGVVLAFHEDEFAVAAVLFVEGEDGVGGGAAAGEGVENDVAGVGDDAQQLGNQGSGLWGIKILAPELQARQFVFGGSETAAFKQQIEIHARLRVVFVEVVFVADSPAVAGAFEMEQVGLQHIHHIGMPGGPPLAGGGICHFRCARNGYAEFHSITAVHTLIGFGERLQSECALIIAMRVGCRLDNPAVG